MTDGVVYKRQCTPKELSVLLPAFNKIASAFPDVDPDDVTSVGLRSPVLNRIISSLPRLREPVKELLDVVNLKKAAQGDKVMMWNDPERYPGIVDSDIVAFPFLVFWEFIIDSFFLSRLCKL